LFSVVADINTNAMADSSTVKVVFIYLVDGFLINIGYSFKA
jgi:hypothetical protein